ncbi:MAG: phosphate acyltransferase PlsX [Gracilibacteraceae bacterium]|jgi:glycerol-3-phosphate acyltransferase PlsX|nr:phosphate acyltransferase PlsX [Gracilibacteraceae bacterium]
MKIAVDAMGGDNAPQAIVLGCIQAVANWPDLEIILVGDPAKIQESLKEPLPDNIVIEKATEIIGMDEHPANAVRYKKDASIVVATRLVKEKQADALVSAGSTGAQMAAALLTLRRIPGINRPAICTVLPAPDGPKTLLDVGANPDADAENLYQFALMGSIYAQHILKTPNPRIALLNIGSEEGKGNKLAQQTYTLLKNSPLNFTGNIEGRDLLQDKADVYVCDAFVGNIALKALEGLSSHFFSTLKEKMTASIVRKIGAAMIMPALREIARSFDYSDYGGAPLLGVNGTSIVCHGSSNAKAIMNAVRIAKECVEEDVILRVKTLVELP